MEAYFEDLLGHAQEQPLKKLQAAQNKGRHVSEALEKPIHKASHQYSKIPPLSQFSAELTQAKSVSSISKASEFAEPERASDQMSPYIIAATFPKLAPPVTQAKSVLPEATATPKRDKKAALAMLLKQKDKLSPQQRIRLKAKLKSLAPSSQPTSAPLIAVPVKVPLVEPLVEQERTVIESTVSEMPVQKITESASPQISISKNGQPDWAKGRFECLLFSVAGLKLAVPLVSLGAIYKIDKVMTPLFGRPTWFIGLYTQRDKHVQVIDTAQWVMPERSSAAVRSAYKFIIRLGGSDWGVACDAVHKSIKLHPDQVKWRTERTKRAWLLGTVIDQMCALIDADALNLLLEQQIRKR